MALDTTLVVAALTLGRIIFMLALLIVAVFATLVSVALTYAILIILVVVIVGFAMAVLFPIMGVAVRGLAVFTGSTVSIAVTRTLVTLFHDTPEESGQLFLLLVFVFILGFGGAAVGVVAVFTRAAIYISITLTFVVTLFVKEFGQLTLVSPLFGGPIFVVLRSGSRTVSYSRDNHCGRVRYTEIFISKGTREI